MNSIEAKPLSQLDYLHFRQNFLPFLQLLFFQPITTNTVTQLKEAGNIAELAVMNLGGKYLQQFFAEVTEVQLQEQEAEFNRLFVGPGPILAPPWESVYSSREHLLFDEATFQVRELYHRFGKQFINENNEPDDHLVIELDFLHFLNNKGLQEGDVTLVDCQLAFLEEHLSRWVPRFCELILKHSDSLLYRGAALLLRDFVDEDLQSLREIKEALVDVR